ncbi:low temperature requirement protein A [Actinobacteria bacterium YIM 96077]|uniref:Low temperature requirement protein A n=1 Tax=Phytoactinopolyspora halophila TaxID=1981511 RepID=A0A329QBP1_9ACTN|nr:low temperature requirement protein A [Phytoactinopolyspora halophila]AYY13972.1 low temperature requirement protein A [Actinobacteria bacterium YIM 96077]RAW09411.1 low temperature requirement protein A [Phytoactinopolyspora halophila]
MGKMVHARRGLGGVRRADDEHRSEVGPIELFFDLVYVFTIIQISHTLLDDLTWTGAAQVGVLFLGVWWVWNYTAWAMNWLDPRSGLVRLLNAVLMLAALGMALAIPHAFDEDGFLFAACYVFAHVVRAAFMVAAYRGEQLGRNYAHLLTWSAAAGVVWLIGGLAPEESRLWIWLFAVFLDYLAPRADFRVPGFGTAPMHTWPVDAEHLAERNRLVFIIALGESILIMGFTLSELDVISTSALVVTGLGFVGLLVQWWNYFAIAGHDVAHTGARSETRVLRSAFAYAHAIMVAGAIVVAVSIELRLTHDTLDSPMIFTTVGGPLIYLAGNLLFLRSRWGNVARSRYVAAALLVLVAVGAHLGRDAMTPLALGLSTVVIMAGLAVYTQLSSGRARASVSSGQG